MNTNQKITNAMNIRSEKQLENVFIPSDKLMDSAVELNEKIKKLKKSIEHQKDTLVNWREEDNVIQSATQYRDEMIEDVIKLEHLKRSFCLVCDEMIRKI